MHKDHATSAKRMVLYSQDHTDRFVCVVEEWDGSRYVESEIRESHERAIYAFLDCKREAIMNGLWQEKPTNTQSSRATARTESPA